MKIIFVFIVSVFSLAASADVCDTLGFKVKVPKVSKIDDRAVGIKLTFDTTKKDGFQKVIIKNEQGEAMPGASLSIVLNDKKTDTLNLFADANGEIVTNKLLSNKTYAIQVSSIGYKTEDFKISFVASTEFIVLKKQYLGFLPVIVKSDVRICRKIICGCFMSSSAFTQYAITKKR